MNLLNKKGGQSLIEILIAISVGVLIIGSAAGALVFTVRSNQQNKATESASPLAQELLDNVRSKAEGNWQSLYDLTAKGDTAQSCPPYCYYLDANLNIVAGSEQKVVNNITYTRYFTVENVNRDNCGTRGIVADAETSCSGSQVGVLNDPSTQKVTAKVTWAQSGGSSEVLIPEYLTRSKNDVNQFTDWSGSSGVAGPVIRPDKDYFSQTGLDTTTTPGSIKLTPISGWLISSTFDTERTDGVAFNSIMWKGSLGTGQNTVKFQLASSNQATGGSLDATGPIDSTDRYAWNDIIGWLDFYGAPGGPATVTASKMTRWATSSDGDFTLDCATTPGGDICATSDFYVSNSAGDLAGWAWNDAYGWISFCGGLQTTDCPGTVAYQVTINQTTGDFSGWAWNDIVGWISFCGGESTTNCPGTVAYKVKIASVSGWSYIGPNGGQDSYYATTGPGVPVPVVTAHHNNKQYYRYKVLLEFIDLGGSTKPVVDDVIVNWSP